MFDLTSSKLLILGIVALIVVGPKELPLLLRTVGKYVGMIRRQAAEFRSQFDEAMRDSELEQIKKDVENVGRDMQTTMREAELSVEREVADANAELDAAISKADLPPPADQLSDLGSLPTVAEPTTTVTPSVLPSVEPAKSGA